MVICHRVDLIGIQWHSLINNHLDGGYYTASYILIHSYNILVNTQILGFPQTWVITKFCNCTAGITYA